MSDKSLVKLFKWFFALSLVIVIMCSPHIRSKVSDFYAGTKEFVVGVFHESEDAQEALEDQEEAFDFNKRTVTVKGG